MCIYNTGGQNNFFSDGIVFVTSALSETLGNVVLHHFMTAYTWGSVYSGFDGGEKLIWYKF